METRGTTSNERTRVSGRERATLTRFASTSNRRMGGTQLPSTTKPPGSASIARGRGKSGARLVASGLSKPAVRWLSESGGTYDASMPSERLHLRHAGGRPTGEKASADE